MTYFFFYLFKNVYFFNSVQHLAGAAVTGIATLINIEFELKYNRVF